jgi:hypothetical protein
MNFDDFDETYHIEKFKNKSKKKNGNMKGKRGEREVVGILNLRFSYLTETFSRSVGSGNRWGQVANMPSHAKETLTGDICCPKGFRFCIESKTGYSKIDMNSVFQGGNTELDSFLEQAEDDAKRCGKPPLLVWKKDRKPWLAFIKTKDLTGNYEYKLNYREWSCITVKDLLTLPNGFFFPTENDLGRVSDNPEAKENPS